MIKSMNHTGFVVRDLERAERFYTEVMGLKVSARRERVGAPISQVVGYEKAHLKIVVVSLGGGPDLELIQYLSPSPAARPTQERSVLGASHLAFVVDDIQKTFRALLAGGAKKMNEPAQVEPGKTVCYLQDPDGNWIELIELKA